MRRTFIPYRVTGVFSSCTTRFLSYFYAHNHLDPPPPPQQVPPRQPLANTTATTDTNKVGRYGAANIRVSIASFFEDIDPPSPRSPAAVDQSSALVVAGDGPGDGGVDESLPSSLRASTDDNRSRSPGKTVDEIGNKLTRPVKDSNRNIASQEEHVGGDCGGSVQSGSRGSWGGHDTSTGYGGGNGRGSGDASNSSCRDITNVEKTVSEGRGEEDFTNNVGTCDDGVAVDDGITTEERARSSSASEQEGDHRLHPEEENNISRLPLKAAADADGNGNNVDSTDASREEEEERSGRALDPDKEEGHGVTEGGLLGLGLRAQKEEEGEEDEGAEEEEEEEETFKRVQTDEEIRKDLEVAAGELSSVLVRAAYCTRPP